MSLISRIWLAGALLVAILAAPSFAQFGGGRGGGGFGGGPMQFSGWAGGVIWGDAQTPAYTRMVVLSNAGALSDTVRGLVAAELVHQLKATAKNDRVKALQSISLGQPMGIPLQGMGDLQLGDSARIEALTIIFSLPDNLPDHEFSDEDEKDFAEIWEQSRQQLETALHRAQQRIADQKEEDHIAKRRALQERLDSAQRELANVIANIEATEEEGAPDQLRSQLEAAQRTLRELQLDRVSAEARREAIVARIDELRAKGEEASQSDPLIEELEEVVKIRERQLQDVRTLRSAAAVAAADLSEAEAAMAQARVELLKAKRAAMADAAGGVLHELNNELSRLVVQLAEIDARSQAVEMRAEKLQKVTSASATNEAEALNRKLRALGRRIESLEEAQGQLEERAPAAMPEITITPLDEALSLGGDNEGDNDAAKAD